MFPQTRDHKITCSPEKSHTSPIIFSIKTFTTSDHHHITLYTARNNWNLNWIHRKHANNGNHVWRKHTDDKLVNGRRLVHWHTFEYLIFDFNVKIIQHSIEIIPNVVRYYMKYECRTCAHINYSHISLVRSLHISFIGAENLFLFCFTVFQNVKMKINPLPVYSISLCVREECRIPTNGQIFSD